MAKLYPPGLAGTLPAFYDNTKVGIPFIRNKAVQNNSFHIKNLIALVKNVSTGELYGTYESFNIDWNNDMAYFDFSSSQAIKRNNFYKIQLAYRSIDGEIGYYSTVGVIRYTIQPIITIENLTLDLYNAPLDKYVGIYSNQDITEKVYSYRFIILDSKGKIFDDSGVLIHNHDYDIYKNRSIDEYHCKKTLKINQIYQIIYEVTTVNGLVASSQKFYLQELETEPLNANISLEVSLDEENAYIAVMAKMLEGFDSPNGSFVITRASSKDNYGTWREIKRFVLENNNLTNSFIFKDYTIEHGFSYKYGIQQYNKYNYKSNRAETFPLSVKFEHMYLFDGERQLKIKFNPKVTNFKETFQEQKVNTLGAKYPYFLRHGISKYKELSISGLISYLSDEKQLFLNEENDLFNEHLQITYKDKYKDRFTYEYSDNQEYGYANTRLDDTNVFAEKIFRDKVLEFLNNGKPKIFKSSTEGNMLVRCMNNTLTPNDTLGRMLYTFNSVLTEVDDYNWENLIEYNLLDVSYPRTNIWFWKTIPTHDYFQIISEKEKLDSEIQNRLFFIDEETNEEFLNIHLGYDIYGIDIADAQPGTKYLIDGKVIVIGASGHYQIELNTPIESFGVKVGHHSGWVTIRYTRETYNEFNVLSGMYINNLPIIQQFQGKRSITEELDNSWEELSNINYFKFIRRPRIKLYVQRDALIHPESIKYNQIESYEDYVQKRDELRQEITYPGSDGKPRERFFGLDVIHTYDSWLYDRPEDNTVISSTLRKSIDDYMLAIQDNAVDGEPRYVEVKNHFNNYKNFKKTQFYRWRGNDKDGYWEAVKGFTHKNWAENWYEEIKDLPSADKVTDEQLKNFYVGRGTEDNYQISKGINRFNYNSLVNGGSYEAILYNKRETPLRIYYTRRPQTQLEIDACLEIPKLEAYYPQLKNAILKDEINPRYEKADWYLHVRNNTNYLKILTELKLYDNDQEVDFIPDYYDKRDFIQNILFKSNYYNYKIYYYPIQSVAFFDEVYKEGCLYERIENEENEAGRFLNNNEQYYIDRACTLPFSVDDISPEFVYEIVSLDTSLDFTSTITKEVDVPYYERDIKLEPIIPKMRGCIWFGGGKCVYLSKFCSYKEDSDILSNNIQVVLDYSNEEQKLNFKELDFKATWKFYKELVEDNGLYKKEKFDAIWTAWWEVKNGEKFDETSQLMLEKRKKAYNDYKQGKVELQVEFYTKLRDMDKWQKVSRLKSLDNFIKEIEEGKYYQPGFTGIEYIKQYLSANAHFTLSIGDSVINNSSDENRKYFYKLGLYEKPEFYIINNKHVKGIPKKTYVQRIVQPEDYYDSKSLYRLKLDDISQWVQNNSKLSYIKAPNKTIEGLGKSIIQFDSERGYNLYKNNPLYTLVCLDEIYDLEYVLRRSVGPNNYISGYYYIKDENGTYIKESAESEYVSGVDYYTKGLQENEIFIYTVDKIHGDYTINEREYISPSKFDTSVKIGINIPVRIDSEIVSTEKKMIVEILDLEKDIVLSGKNFTDIAQLEIGWGVECLIIYHLRTRNYAFPELQGKQPDRINLYEDKQKLLNYVNYINNLSDQILFYREGDNNANI